MQNKKEKNNNTIILEYSEIKLNLENVLKQKGFSDERASVLAGIYADNNLYGKDSHGVNRFEQFINAVINGYVKVDSQPAKITANNAFEQWDGNLGAGPLNAKLCTERAVALAEKHGIGCVALRNTNHWMRGGTYGWQAAEAGYILICWTNAIPTMPPWGSDEPKLGNNPLVIAIPKEGGHLVLDMAMSQYSYGKLETLLQSGSTANYYGGYDKGGNLTKDPAEIIATKRALPVGLWKGAGLALMLDLIAAILSGGRSSYKIGKEKVEVGVSQIFIAVKPGLGTDTGFAGQIINETLSDLASAHKPENNEILYPGEMSYKKKEENLQQGIPVDKKIWNKILKM